ncbi:ABC transporter ATP-binding protein [Atopobiaceae bacterium 24-176]
MKVFRYLKGHGLAVALVVVLLVVQANLELSLPGYMSDIIDVGVQQGGIEGPVPRTISEEGLSDLEMFMAEPDVSLVESVYGKAGADGIRAYTGTEAQAADGGEVAGAMALPECVALSLEQGIDPSQMSGAQSFEGMESSPQAAELMATPQGRGKLQAVQRALQSSDGKLTMDVVRSLYDAGLVDRAELVDAANAMSDAMGPTAGSIVSQRAVDYVRSAYLSQGVNLDQVRSGYLGHMALIMFGLCAATLATTVCVGLIASRTAASVARGLRSRLFSKVMNLAPYDVDRFSPSSLITRCTNDVQQVQMVIVMLLRMILLAPIMGVVAFIQVCATKSGLEWIIAVALLALLAIVGLLMGFTMPKFRRMQSLVDHLNLVSRNMLDGLMPVRAFGREGYELKRFDEANVELRDTQLFTNRSMSLLMPAIMLLMNLMALSIVWFGGFAVDSGTMQVGTMMAFISYSVQIVMAFMILSMVAVMLPRAEVSAGRINEVLDSEPLVSDPVEPVTVPACAPTGRLCFDDVTFRYPDAADPVVSSISFETAPGHTTAIIGSTGSGKTTLVKLVPRFFDASEGTVSLDGVDVRDMALDDLRGRIGYVPQQGLLFSGTIRSNLLFGAPDATEEDLRWALEVSQSAEFVDRLPEGLDTPVAQGGTSVSGGQRQRLSIARALARKPEVLVFDDSFSALDYATDARLRDALARQVHEAAVVIVAQRVATIMHADEILVLDRGTLVGRGTHEELLAACPTYLEIARSQLSDEELDLTEAKANGLVADGEESRSDSEEVPYNGR